MPRLHYSIFMFIRFCRYPTHVETALFLYKQREKDIHYSTARKEEESISVFLAYDHSYCSVFLKLCNGDEALAVISPEQLVATNSLTRSTSKTWCLFHLTAVRFL